MRFARSTPLLHVNRPGRERYALIVNMIVGSGIDLVEIDRIQRAVDRFGARFLDRVYTPAEQAYCLRKRNASESLAARFAAKEAGAKALGTGISQGVNWLEIEVVREPGGRPGLRFHGRAALRASTMRATHAALSLTHSKDLAIASVVLESGEMGTGRLLSSRHRGRE
jgi:holo-[acyl-carrier protein] synthase